MFYVKGSAVNVRLHNQIPNSGGSIPVVADGVRLQKVLSQAGIASRRVAEKMILDGRVEVDDRVVTELGTRVNPDVSVIRVDGARVTVDDTLVHLAINKPHSIGRISICLPTHFNCSTKPP